LPNHPITPLASSQLNHAGGSAPHHDLSIELIEPDNKPAAVRIVWPPEPTVVDPKRFPDVAAHIARLFSEAHVALAAIKRGGRCDAPMRRNTRPR
jgi:hypothetical protein